MTPIEAARPIVNFADELVALGLHSDMLWVYEFNPAAIRCYEKVGFRECGRRRESRWFNGRFWDEIAMDLPSAEFASPVLKHQFAPPR